MGPSPRTPPGTGTRAMQTPPATDAPAQNYAGAAAAAQACGGGTRALHAPRRTARKSNPQGVRGGVHAPVPASVGPSMHGSSSMPVRGAGRGATGASGTSSSSCAAATAVPVTGRGSSVSHLSAATSASSQGMGAGYPNSDASMRAPTYGQTSKGDVNPVSPRCRVPANVYQKSHGSVSAISGSQRSLGSNHGYGAVHAGGVGAHGHSSHAAPGRGEEAGPHRLRRERSNSGKRERLERPEPTPLAPHNVLTEQIGSIRVEPQKRHQLYWNYPTRGVSE